MYHHILQLSTSILYVVVYNFSCLLLWSHDHTLYNVIGNQNELVC